MDNNNATQLNLDDQLYIETHAEEIENDSEAENTAEEQKE